MEFKIDTKPDYAIITPVSPTLNAILAESLKKKCGELAKGNGLNIIIDLHNCLTADENACNILPELHVDIYSANRSLVFSNLSTEILAGLKNNGMDMMINIAPTIAEAIDIISMEILERDLFDEES